MTIGTKEPVSSRAPHPPEDRRLRCRSCGAPLHRTFVNLGMSPPCEDFLTPDRLDDMERFYPLHARICEECLLVQLPADVRPDEIFREYAYFSSYSDSWVAHAARYAVEMRERFQLDSDSLVVEVASNDGYLLQHFVRADIPVLGIEPARNVAAAALERGVPTITEFFGEGLARRLTAEGRRADLLVGNNVFAHVPDLNDFTAGLAEILAPDGVLTLEFPHLVQLIEQGQFDTIYHEHYSYLTLGTAKRILGDHGLAVFDVEELPTHGGSLRVFAAHAGSRRDAPGPRVASLLERERTGGYADLSGYLDFERRVQTVKGDLLEFLIASRRDGRSVAGYGAPGKGNTLLNYCGIGPDLLPYTVDRNPYKHGRFTPGMHIPIHPPERIAEDRPDFVLILPWNLRDEIIGQLAYIREWGGRFVVPIPALEIAD
jgi:SAM-dependent methyltransferase